MGNDQQQRDRIFQTIKDYCQQNHHHAFNPAKPVVRLHEPSFGAEDIMAALTPMLTTFVTMGKEVKNFEKQYCKHFEHKYGVMNNSGSSANLLAVAALTNPALPDHLKPGDEVLVPALSWSTTVWPLIQHQLVPVFVDCDLDSFNFDMNKLEAAITPKTRAIMLVHVYGNPCDMTALLSIAEKHNLQVIEDCCESMGATYEGRAVGSFGRIGTLSFYYSHHITTLEGGICVTNEFELSELMRVLRAHGWSREAEEHQKYISQYPDIDPRFIFINLGYNLRPTECQGAMGQVQLPKLSGFIKTRREAAHYFRKSLDKYSDFLHFQKETPKGHHVWFGFPAIVKDGAPFTVKEITAHMQQNHIETRPIIAGNMARHPALKMFEHRVSGELENCDIVMRRGFAFGCHHHVNQAAREYVTGIIDDFMKKKGLEQAA